MTPSSQSEDPIPTAFGRIERGRLHFDPVPVTGRLLEAGIERPVRPRALDLSTVEGDLEAAAGMRLAEALEAEREALKQACDRLARHLEPRPPIVRARLVEAVAAILEDPEENLLEAARSAHSQAARTLAEALAERLEDLEGIRARPRKRQVAVTAVATVDLEVAGERFPLTVRRTVTTDPLEAGWYEPGGDAGRLATLFGADAAEAGPSLAAGILENELEPWRALAARMDAGFWDREDRPGFALAQFRSALRDAFTAAGDRPAEETAERLDRQLATLDTEATQRQAVARSLSDPQLIRYRELFPEARTRDRRITFYMGPTNSGKTYHALNRLAEADRGVYLAPLRLLALEGQEELEKRGVRTSFITGEARDEREGATHIASTIEMLSLERPVDAAVIDEIQLLADESRGWAWTQALAGVPARDVLLTGSPDALPLVEALADYLDEPLEVVELERHTPLQATPGPLDLDAIEPGTAVVAFSRRRVHEIRRQLAGRYSVATIYGNLTPEVRRAEARRFRTGEAEVLVSTDAIGLGLNLPIRTVVLAETEKYNGRAVVPLTDREILQITGRAGRYGQHDAGYAAATDAAGHQRIRAVLADDYTPTALPRTATAQPHPRHIDALWSAMGDGGLAPILEAFRRRMRFDTDLLSAHVPDEMLTLAGITDDYPTLGPDVRMGLASAPVDVGSRTVMASYRRWVEAVARGRRVGVPDDAHLLEGAGAASSDRELYQAEMEAKRLMVYTWLSYRFPEQFAGRKRADRLRRVVDRYVAATLEATASRPTPRRRGQRRAAP